MNLKERVSHGVNGVNGVFSCLVDGPLGIPLHRNVHDARRIGSSRRSLTLSTLSTLSTLCCVIPNPQKQYLWTITVILRKAPTRTVGDARQPVRRPKDLYRKRAGFLTPKPVVADGMVRPA